MLNRFSPEPAAATTPNLSAPSRIAVKYNPVWVTTREEAIARASNLLEAALTRQRRLLATGQFGTPEELEEIGFLALRFAAMEEPISLYCEILLLRPELAGFHPSTKLVSRKQFSDKINLFAELVIACGTLYEIDVEPVQKAIGTLKNVGEDRNTVIHGMLLPADGTGSPYFSNRGRNLQADLLALRNLTEASYNAELQLITAFSEFYTKLIEKRSTNPDIEPAVKSLFVTAVAQIDSSVKVRKDLLAVRPLQAQANAAREKLEASREAREKAKRELRNARARVRRIRKRAKTD